MQLEDIPAGFQDIYKGVADSNIENPQISNKVGDGEPSVTLSAPKEVELTVPAGTVGGTTSFDLVVDGRVGDGEAPIITQFSYNTVAADATTIGFTKVRREAIP